LDWLARYEAGQQIHVWAELTSLGADVRDSGRWDEAVAVTHATMDRARKNVEYLLQALPAVGFVFARDAGARHVQPNDHVGADLDGVEEEVGSLPYALRAWFEIVGMVDLTGHCPEWDFDLTDPLVVDAPIEFIRSEYVDWRFDHGTEWDRGPFEVSFAPDYLHKADISGGMPYGVRVPDRAIDTLVLWEPHQTTFVNYLRTAFRWAGLPGWDPASGHDGSAPPRPLPAALTEIASDLVPI
jgi:hypothetical protein